MSPLALTLPEAVIIPIKAILSVEASPKVTVLDVVDILAAEKLPFI